MRCDCCVVTYIYIHAHTQRERLVGRLTSRGKMAPAEPGVTSRAVERVIQPGEGENRVGNPTCVSSEARARARGRYSSHSFFLLLRASCSVEVLERDDDFVGLRVRRLFWNRYQMFCPDLSYICLESLECWYKLSMASRNL